MVQRSDDRVTTLKDRPEDRPVAVSGPPGLRTQPWPRLGARWLSVAAALSIAVGGYVHYCLYRNGYRIIPVIGPGFLIQVISSVILAVALVVPWGERRIGRWVLDPSIDVRVGALALSVGTLIAFGLTRRPGGLFNFQERGLQPAPQALIALVAESAALILLTAALVLDWLGRRLASGRGAFPGRPVAVLARVRRR